MLVVQFLVSEGFLNSQILNIFVKAGRGDGRGRGGCVQGVWRGDKSSAGGGRPGGKKGGNQRAY